MGKSRNPVSPTEEDLEEAALRYVERFSSSVAGVRRILRNRMRRAAGGDVSEAADPAAAIEAVLAKLVRLGLLDDARYAGFRAASLARRGASLFTIRRDLKLRGVPAREIDAALAALKAEAGGTNSAADRQAAVALARRRRIGPFREPGARAHHREHDLAVLGRAGFAFEIARAVIDGDAEDG